MLPFQRKSGIYVNEILQKKPHRHNLNYEQFKSVHKNNSFLYEICNAENWPTNPDV